MTNELNTRPLPVPEEGTVLEYDGLVIMTLKDWEVIGATVARSRREGINSGATEAKLVAMQLSKVEEVVGDE